MSLFGGELSASQSPAPSPTPSSPEPSQAPSKAQPPPLVSFTLDSDEDDEFGDDEASDASDDGSSRPNQYGGRPDSWRVYTRAERQVVSSLEKVESEDLAAHLYNTHNLKHRVRQPTEQLMGIDNCQSKDSWLKKRQALGFVDLFGETQTELVPRKDWTAWPVPPKLIPRKRVGVSRADSDEDTWYIEDAGAQDAGEVMREEVLALFLRQAKDKWRAREYEPVDKATIRTPKDLAVSNAAKERFSRTTSITSDHEMKDTKNDVKSATSMSESDTEGEFNDQTGKRRGHQPEPRSVKTAFLANDDEARRIMQPSIDSLLARVDHLALAIRRSRLNHIGFGAYSSTSGSEFTSDAESVDPSSKSRRRSRSKSKTSEGKDRQKTPTEHTDSNSGSEYENNDTISRSSSPPRRDCFPNDSSSDHPNSRGISKQHSLMDWSEVLGIASIIGWDQEAIARAAQRCATLFDEGISFRIFDEGRSHERVPSPIRYEPSTIPPLDLREKVPPKRPYFEVGTLRCPHKDCKDSGRRFPIPYRVIEHVYRNHGYDPRTNDSDNEDRKVGGVHIDGFMQPIGPKLGWLGGGRAKGGKKRVEAEQRGLRRKDAKKQKVEEEADPIVIEESKLE